MSDTKEAVPTTTAVSNAETESSRRLAINDNPNLRKKVLWKLDLHILPALALLWLAAFIDRTNIGNARIAGLQTDLHLTGNQFNITLAVFYIPYILIEMPSNWVLKRMRPNIWLPLLVLVWGVVTTLSGLVQNFGGLVAVRMALGLCEGGLLPGLVLYLSTMYERHELQLRISLFYASASLSGAFGGLLASAILKMKGVGGLAGWRWIFILEGIASCIIALYAMIALPENLAKAKFLTSEEREFAINRFYFQNKATDQAPVSPSPGRQTPESTEKEAKKDHGTRHVEHVVHASAVHQETEKFEWREAKRGIFEIQVWLTGIAYFSLIVSLYSFSLFLPTIVTGLQFSGEQAQLHTVPPYVPATILTVVVAFFADRLRWRGPFILMLLPLTIAGYIIMLAATTNTAKYAGTFLIAAGVYPSAPCLLSILPNNSAGHYKKATTTALQLAIANCGAFIATFIYTQDQAPTYHRAHSIVLGFQVLAWILIATNVSYCLWENKARAAGKRQYNLQRHWDLWDAGLTRAPIGDRSPDFRFTL